MAKFLKKKFPQRLISLALSLCCLFSMFPAAGAVDDTADGSETTGDLAYRYVWLISQPGFQIKIMPNPNNGNKLTPYVSNMNFESSSGEWMAMKQTKHPVTGEDIYVVDINDPSYINPMPDEVHAGYDDIGLVHALTNFNKSTIPVPDAWPNAPFEYVRGTAQSFDPNKIDETNNNNTEWWAGNITGNSNCYTYPDPDDWQKCINKSEYTHNESEYFPSTLWSEPIPEFTNPGTLYWVQFYARATDINYFIGEYENNISRDNYSYGNNTMFKFQSQDMLGMPNFNDMTKGTVIFDFNLPGNDATVQYLQNAGTTVDVPTITTQDVQGVTFRFKGWFDAPQGGNQVSGTVEVPAGQYKVYYAQWELVVPEIPPEIQGQGDMYIGYFDYNYEGGGVTSAYCAAGVFTWTVIVDGESKTYTAKLPFQFPEDPEREGYEFGGWATNPDGSGKVDKSWLPTQSDNTVFAIWTPKMYTLTWDANGGTGGSTTQQSYDTEIKPGKEPTREGYTFGGWYLDRDCSAPLASGTMVKKDQTFYAKWTAEKVIVNYYDTRQGTSLVTTQEYNYNDLFKILDGMTSTDGWTFQNWATAEGHNAASFNDQPLTSDILEYKEGSGAGVASDAGYWVLDLYAVWGQETADFTATVRWDDFTDNDGCRPTSVHLGLVSSINDELIADTTVTDDGTNLQTYVFTDLPITTADTSVEKITYKLIFLGYTDADGVYREIHDTAASSGEIEGASSSKYDDTVLTTYKYAINNYVSGYAAYIKLDHNLITTGDDIAFTIDWDDESDNDGVRPSSLNLVLYANGTMVRDNPMHNSGTGVVRVNEGNCTVGDDGDSWTYVFKDYQKYLNGQAIDYTVAIKNNDLQTTFNGNGYTTTYYDYTDEAIGAPKAATLSRPIELIDKTLTIHWDDESNRDNERPESVTVNFNAYQWNNKTYRWETVKIEDYEMTGDVHEDTWSHTFEQVKKYNGGELIVYEAEVTSDLNAHIVEGGYQYSWTASGLDVTISKNRNVKSVNAKIEWDDQQNNDNIRPSTVILRLYADGVALEGAEYAKLLTGDPTADTWEYTFENLPVYREGEEGQEILYTVAVEEAVEDSIYGTYISTANGEKEEVVRYTASYMNADGESTDDQSASAYAYVKLTHALDQGSMNIYASWHDDQNRDGKRPSSIQVDLYKWIDGEKSFVKTYTINAGANNAWTYRLTGLPLYEDGKAVSHTIDVSEDFRQQLLDSYGYTVSLEGNVVHLYYTPSVGYVTGHINWQDGNDNDNMRPDSVTGTLYANGKSTGQTLSFNADNDWTQTWKDVASYYNNDGVTGTPVVYTIVVDTPDGYQIEYSPESTTTVDPHDIQINLSHETDQQSLEGKVYWNDNGNSDGKRPESISVQLYANGEKVVGKTADVTGDGDTWNVSFDGLDIYKDGKPIDYTIKLNDDTGNTYHAMTAGMNLYLSYEAEVSNLNVSFNFDDKNNVDGARPKVLYVRLTADGIALDGSDYEKTVQFSVDGNEVNFVNLPVYSVDGKKIAYNAVVEFDPIYGGEDYKVSTSRDVELSTGGNTNRIVIELSRESDTGTETGRIYWFDNNNQRGNRPKTLTVDVKNSTTGVVVGTYTIDSEAKTVTNASGSVVGGVTVSEWGLDNGSSCWEYTIEGLPQNIIVADESVPITYVATARKAGIANWYDVIDGESLDVNLTHKNYSEDVGASEQNFAVNIAWMDNNNAWKYRPNTNGVDITLLANGEEYDTIHLTQANALEGNANAWTYTFEKLPTYLNGHAVVWTAAIGDIDKYTETVSNQSTYATITMTQSIGFDFVVNWNDSDDDDAVRPESVTVDVYGDGAKVGSVALTGEGNQWTGSITDLAVWREVGTDTPVSYSFRWSEDTAAAMLDEGYAAAPTMNGTPVEADTFYWTSATEWGSIDGGVDDLTGQYQWETTLTRNKETKTVYADILWNDDGNRDGLRPDSIFVQLYANGVAIGNATEVTGESTASSWPVSWTEQDVYDGGKPIVYTIQMVSVPDGYAESNDETGLNITLTHEPERVDVKGSIIWDDKSEAHYEYNSLGDLINSYYQIERTNVFMQLLVNGQPYGGPVLIPVTGYTQGDGSILNTATRIWDDMFVHENEGETLEYTFLVYSDELDALLNDGYTQTYDFSQPYDFSTTISHTYYDVRGKVYYLYDTSDEFLLEGVPVTAYLYDEETGTYSAVGSDVTDENGNYEILNIPQGKITVRATYQYGDYTYAGSRGVNLSLCDANDVDLIVDRDAEADSDLYRYTASGNAYYQTDRTNEDTITPVPAGSVALLYKIVDGADNAQYVAMTTTDANGAYSFGELADGTYLVSVVFGYNGGTYTYDNADAQADGLSFLVSGSDVKWPDVIKQVNADVEPGPEPDPGEDPDPEPEPTPEPCVVDGNVFFSDNGVHTTDPVEGVDVFVYTAENNAQVGAAVTDENGHWTVEGLAAGDYIGVFSYASNASRVLHFTISDSDYEKGTYTAATQYFDRNSDKTTATIRGVVLDQNGNQSPALVQIQNRDGDIVDIAYTDQNGFYDFTVQAGFTYRVIINNIESKTEYLTAGDPDDDLTTLENYTVSGNFSIDGVPQEGSIIALYKQNGEDFDLLNATLTNAKGDYTLQAMEAGNYRVALYVDGKVYENHYVSVGYQEYEPVVTENNGTYSITGNEPNGYDSAILYNVTTDVVKRVAELGEGNMYSFDGLEAGSYRIEFVKGDNTTTYYVDAPDNKIAVDYVIGISGKIVDEDGNPRLGAVVTLLDQYNKPVGEQTIITDGKFSYTDLPSGEYRVKVDYPVAGTELLDRTTAETDSYGAAYPDGMTPGSVWSWNINAQTVSGTVKDQKGEPISGATVVLKDNANPDKVYGIETDENGNWSIGVKKGDYTATAMYEYNADHIYHSVGSVPVTVADGDVTGIDIVINRYTVTGTAVRDGDNQPLADAEVTINYADGSLAWEGKTDEDGKFIAPLYSDDYKVIVNYGDESANMDITVDNDMDITLKVGIPITISGTVFDADGKPVPDGIVYYDGAAEGKVYTDDDGHYSINITASQIGSYTLYAEAAGKASEKVTVNVTTDTVQDLTLTKQGGEQIPTGERTVSGIVTDNEGNRLANSIVTITFGDDKHTTMTTSTDRNGAFRFENLPDGTYYLSAVYESDNGYTYSTNGETAVHVNGADVTDVTLAVSLSFNVMVSVEDIYGRAVPDATVTYQGAADGSGVTASDGTVAFKLPAGEYQFKASTTNRESEMKTVVVEQNTLVRLVIDDTDIKDEPPMVESNTNSINGYVIDPDGNAVEGATVTLLKFNIVSEAWEPVNETASNSDGYYEFLDIGDGRFRVETSYDLSKTVQTEVQNFTLHGYALDDDLNPYVGATVNLYDKNDPEHVLQTVSTDETGYYEFIDVASGDYIVEIIPAEDPSAKWTEEQTVVSGSSVVAGTVVDVNGDPVSGATVVVTGPDGNGGPWTMVTGDDGKYSFEVPNDGDYNIAITYPDSYDVYTDGSYTNNPNDPIKPTLIRDNFKIYGYVHDTDENVIAGATVILKSESGDELDRTTTNDDGYYEFVDLDPGKYIVTVVWEDKTKDYTVDTSNPEPVTPPEGDEFAVTVTVKDYSGNPIVGATVSYDGAKSGSSQTNSSGVATINLNAGRYTFTASADGYEDNSKTVTISDASAFSIVLNTKDGGSEGGGEGPDEPNPDPKPDKVSISGTVVTDHRNPLSGAVVTVTNEDTGDSFTTETNADGRFSTGEMENGRYKLVAEYTHKYGTNESDPIHLTTSQNNAVLVIVLKYVADVNGDGKDEVVYAGEDDKFDTSDDWYPADIDGDGNDEKVEAGEDGKPGTSDDHYGFDVDHDGDNETVYVGDDRIPGTEDDYYLSDPDKDGEDEKIFADGDGIPGTSDDFYYADPDKDGEDEVIHVADDTKPGTPDDWYESDPDNDGEDEKVFVGEDGIPGTDDDWYYDDDGNKVPVGSVYIKFNATGGTVNGESIYKVLKSELHSLPNATRSGYTFDGWFSSTSGGTALTLTDIAAFPITTTVYAHWTKTTESGGGGIGGGGGAGGGIGGGGAVETPTDDEFTVTIDKTPGAVIDPVGEQTVEKGDDLTVTIKPEDGYVITDVVVDGESVGVVDEYTFKDIQADHSLKVVVQPEKMLTDEHIAYVGGYPDGTVRPEANITRAEVATIFYRLLTNDARALYESDTSTFTDVKNGAWYTTAIATLAKAGIINGYEDGTFRPDANISRAEFAAIAARFDHSNPSVSASFTDISGHWAKALIERASALGWVNGYKDGTFRPNVAITRAEAVTLINRVLDRDTLTSSSLLDGMKTWPDNAQTAWYYLAVQEATNGHTCTMENGVEVWTELQ